MNKHAYLIIAHGNWVILEKLLNLLDDEKNDIYLHIDAKVTDFPNANSINTFPRNLLGRLFVCTMRVGIVKDSSSSGGGVLLLSLAKWSRLTDKDKDRNI